MDTLPASAEIDFDALLQTGIIPSEMAITLSPEALKEALRLASDEPAYLGLPLRVYLDGKGCDGFFYGVAFDSALPTDIRFTQDTVDIIVDPESFRFIYGASVVWVNDERGTGFLVENPNHRKFRGKFFKRKSWQEQLEKKQSATKCATSSSQS